MAVFLSILKTLLFLFPCCRQHEHVVSFPRKLFLFVDLIVLFDICKISKTKECELGNSKYFFGGASVLLIGIWSFFVYNKRRVCIPGALGYEVSCLE